MASLMSTLNNFYDSAIGNITNKVGQRTLATLIGVTPNQLEDILKTANEQPSLCYVPIQAESMTKRRQVDVSNTMLISQTSQAKTYITDNSAPHPREWNIRGYIKALLPLVESGLLIKPTLTVQETILDTASESRQKVKLKTDTGEIVDVLIKSLTIGSTPKGTNVRTIDVTVQEVSVLENSITNAFNTDATGSASIPVQVIKNLGKNLTIAGGGIMSVTALMDVAINTDTKDIEEALYGSQSTQESSETDTNTVAKPETISNRDLTVNDPVPISCSTAGAMIIYTTDGSEPVEGGTQYTEPIIAKEPFTLKARAFKSGMHYSDVLFAKFTVNGVSPIPALPAVTSNVPSGNVTSGTVVYLSNEEPGTVIMYTTDGSTPTYNSKVYSTPFVIQNTVHIKAIAVKSGYINSDVLDLNYNVASAPVAPTVTSVIMTPSTGAVIKGTKVTMSCNTDGATIKYTTDGTTPSLINGLIYAGQEIEITAATTFKAFAIKSGMNDSAVGTFTYTIAKVADVTASPDSGKVAYNETVALDCATLGATIRYTTDGTDPTPTTGTIYGGAPIKITTAVTIKAIAYKDNMDNSNVVTFEYTTQ